MQISTLRYALILIWLVAQPAIAQDQFPVETDQQSDNQDSVMIAIRELRREIKFYADSRDYETVGDIRQQLKTDFDSVRYLTISLMVSGFLAVLSTSWVNSLSQLPPAMKNLKAQAGGRPSN